MLLGLLPLAAAVLALPHDSVPQAPLVAPLARPHRAAAVVPRDTEPRGVRRPRAVEYSDAYGRRLTIHRWGSYVMLPLFATQYTLGSRLLDQKRDLFDGRRREPVSAGLRRTHAIAAGGVGALFVVNTVTGAWNLIEARRDPTGRGLRTTHALTMLAADAGFVATGLLGSRATDRAPSDARTHRNTALASMGVATVGAGMMWLLNRD
jgi:hypothetical protein